MALRGTCMLSNIGLNMLLLTWFGGVEGEDDVLPCICHEQPARHHGVHGHMQLCTPVDAEEGRYLAQQMLVGGGNTYEAAVR